MHFVSRGNINPLNGTIPFNTPRHHNTNTTIRLKLGPLELGYPLNPVTPPKRSSPLWKLFTPNQIRLIIDPYVLFDISTLAFLPDTL